MAQICSIIDINGRRISLEDGVTPKKRMITETELGWEYQVGIYKNNKCRNIQCQDWRFTSLTIFAIIDDFPVPDSPSKTHGELLVDVI